MAIKQRKPTNAASRFQTYLSFDEITAERPHKPLTEGKSSSGGRNNRGELTSWGRGGGPQRRRRGIEFPRGKHAIPAPAASTADHPHPPPGPAPPSHPP